MKYTTDKFEIGWVVGPWIRIGQYEIGIGTYTVADVEAILYQDEDDNKQAIVLSEEPKRGRGWKYLGRRATTSGGWTRAFSFSGRTLYLISFNRAHS